ncbi:unnamed protein product [Rotaria socialis]|uniref:Palmitoyltransferase n=2 Tax=Rotaria socialis TaxID=392032 RepID=A0A818RW73_9BILA|nr:unnamed protein product [Rotaria socialis]CAF4275523.1 unnamed protein product [Rotaria socialis]
MRVCRCSFRSFLPCVKLNEIRFCHRLYLIYQVFYLNNDDSVDLRIDTLLQPLFFLTDRLTKYIGRLFICFFIIIISTTVYIFYTSIFVHLINDIQTQHSYLTVITHFIVSHWLLINIMFNYLQCVRVDPGSSPNFGYSKPYEFDREGRDSMKAHQAIIDKNNNANNNNNKSKEVTILALTNDNFVHTQFSPKTPLDASDTIINSNDYTQNVCRKCIFPKPARAHHCSVCSRCILNLDHHCPWINNCVGHLNHRYFFQFCFFLTIGSFYAASFGFSEFQHYLFGRKAFSYLDLVTGRRINEIDILPDVTSPSVSYTFLFLFIVALTACIVLVGFTLWHIWLISRAETTIDFHTNASERKRLKKLKQKFINPYDLGLGLNWKMFLGVNRWYEIFYKNCLPSSHRPFCNGINWPRRNPIYSFEDEQKSKLMHV